VKLLVKSFELAADKLPNSAKLVLIGKGQEWVQVKQMVDRSPVRDRILMPGYLTNEELNEWKQNIRIGVMPGSNWYGSPLKLFEYAFAGIPFVAPKTPTIQYIFREGQDALYIDEKSKLDSLASQMVKLYLDIDLQRRINQSALERITESFPEKKLSAFLENVK
jgi:glycosyltransferase involved in cell wall biosynthesis